MEYKTITVTKPRFGIGRILCLLVGLFLLASALLVSLTIIGIFAGAVLLILSLPFSLLRKAGLDIRVQTAVTKKMGWLMGR